MKDDYMKQHIVKTTIAMLEDGYDLEALTVRKIATKANVAIGLLNYHFGSKKELLSAVTTELIEQVSAEALSQPLEDGKDYRKKLRSFLIETSLLVDKYALISRMIVEDDLLKHSFSTPRQLLEILSKIKPEYADDDLEWLAVMLVTPIQVFFLQRKMAASKLITKAELTEIIDRSMRLLQL